MTFNGSFIYYKPGSPALPEVRGSQRHFTTLFSYDFNLGLFSIFFIAVNVVTKITNINFFQREIMLNKYPKIHVNSFKKRMPGLRTEFSNTFLSPKLAQREVSNCLGDTKTFYNTLFI